MTIPAVASGVRCALNFSGDQHRRMMAAAYSSNSRKEQGASSHNRNFRDRDLPVSPSAKDTHVSEVPEELVDGVKNMVVDPMVPNLNDDTLLHEPGKVSGLDSYMGSSDTSGGALPDSKGSDHPTMSARLATAKGAKLSSAGDRRNPLGVHGAAKDIEKPRRNRKAENIVATIEELEGAGLVAEGSQIKKERVSAKELDCKLNAKDGESLAKRSRQTFP